MLDLEPSGGFKLKLGQGAIWEDARERFVEEPAFEDISLESEKKRTFKGFVHVFEQECQPHHSKNKKYLRLLRNAAGNIPALLGQIQMMVMAIQEKQRSAPLGFRACF